MIITGIAPDEFVTAVDKLSETTYGGNLYASIGREYSARRFAARVMVRDSGAAMFGQRIKQSAPGARRSWNGRRIPAACWHAYRDALAAVFDINPDARVSTMLAKYIGRDGFLENYPPTAHVNIGSMFAPAHMPDLCDCDVYGIDTREEG